MDSNGAKFLLLNAAEDFRTDSRDTCIWDEEAQLMRLAAVQRPRYSSVSRSVAKTAWQNARPMVQDGHKQLGFLSADNRQLRYSLGWPIRDPQPVLASSESQSGASLAEISLDPVDAPADTTFRDLHLGGDGRAALPYSNDSDRHGLLMLHLGRRWQMRCAFLDAPKRAWVDHLNRTWVAADDWLVMCSGEPLPQPYVTQPGRFEPLHINPHPLQRQWRQALPPGYALLAMAADEDQLYLLMEHSVDAHQRVFVRSLDDDAQAPIRQLQLPELPFVIDIAPMGAGRLALMLVFDGEGSQGHRALDLPVVDVPLFDANSKDSAAKLRVLARRYPQHSQLSQRFVSGQGLRVHYVSEAGPKRLHPLQQARFATEGQATLNQTLDSGEPDALWHRIYMDACVPPGCAFGLELKAFDELAAPGSDWQVQAPPHLQTIASELPFYESRFGAVSRTSQPSETNAARDKQGLFEVLLQRQGGAVRELRGRYLQIRVRMRGDGRHSPAIAAMRVYYPRFSWQRAYLPEHFHQQGRPSVPSGIEGDSAANKQAQSAAANGADIRERMLAAFEGIATPLEGRIAASECLLMPQSAPADKLAGLAAMLGCQLPASWPLQRQRNWLQFHAELQAAKGTFAGLCLALDIATDGALSLGQVVVVENYRLRRTLATVLGIDMDDRRHPLTLGTGQSGNSIVGESLILSDDEAREFLALFAPELSESARDRRAVDAFFDRHAFRLSVVLHSDAAALRETIQQVLTSHTPAHLKWKLLETDQSFVLGLSPLLGIDTYLSRQISWREVVTNATYLGREGVIRNPVALAPTYLSSAHVRRSQGDSL